MKTTMTIKQSVLALAIALSIVSCKKDKKTDPTPIPVEVKAITLTDLKALSTGASVKVPDAKKIIGTVISDASGKNVDSKTVILQEAANQPGIIINFDAAQTFVVGDQLEVNISNQTLAKVNEEIVLDKVPVANAKKSGTGTISARTTSADEVVKNAAAWDGTLVTLGEGSFSGGDGKYKGTLTFTDGKGVVKSNVMAGAAFENTAYAPSVGTLTGIVRVNGTEVRVDIRKTADVTTGAFTKVITDDFSNVDFLGNTTIISVFATSVSSYQLSGADLAYFPGAKFDAGLPAGKSYVYMGVADPFFGESSYMNIDGNFVFDHTGLKQVSVTFAGSNISGDVWPQYSSSDQDPAMPTKLDKVFPFDAAKDYFQLSFYVGTSLQNVAFDKLTKLMFASQKVTKTDELTTVTWKVPARADFVAAGCTDFELTQVDEWLKKPDFYLMNTSTRSAAAGQTYKFAPIIIDKIVYSFGK